ncbi:MAG: HlyC/CorC family transporter [Acholeplasma sp.]|nr:MAG: HlyC/CorC family transporter [Acholeplasma sp.]
MLVSMIIMIILIILTAISTASDTALLAISDNRVEEDADEGNIAAKRVQKVNFEPKRYRLGLHLFSVLAALINGAIAFTMFRNDILDIVGTTLDWLETIILIAIGFLLIAFHVVFGQMIPERIANKHSVRVAYRTIIFVIFLSYVLSPLIWLFDHLSILFGYIFGLKANEGERKVTEEEIRTIVEESSKTGSIDEEESEMIQNVFDFSDTTVDEIMTHRTEIAALNIRMTRVQVIDLIQKEQYTRYPVFEDNIDHIIGTLHVKDLLKYIDNPDEKLTLKKLIRPPYFVPESKKTAELFREMQKQKNHIAVVLDEYGGTSGIVTMEDLIEEILGNIADEYDEDEEGIKLIDKDTYEIDGLLTINDVDDVIDADLPVEDYDTISGFILGQLGRFPEENEHVVVHYNGFTFEVLEIDDKVINKVRVTKESSIDDEEKVE